MTPAHRRASLFPGYPESSKSAGFRRFPLKAAIFRMTLTPKSRGHDSSFPASIRERSLMNKNDLIAAVADTTGMSKANAGQAVDATFDAITNALKVGDEVKVIGLDNFRVAKRAASPGRNPRTGEAIAIAASETLKFRAGKALKDAVNRRSEMR